MDYQYYRQTIEALNSYGHTIIHLKDEDTVIIPSNIQEYTPSDNRFYTLIKGKDVTDKMEGFRNILHDAKGILSLIESIKEYTYKWSYNVRYKEFQAF